MTSSPTPPSALFVLPHPPLPDFFPCLPEDGPNPFWRFPKWGCGFGTMGQRVWWCQTNEHYRSFWPAIQYLVGRFSTSNQKPCFSEDVSEDFLKMLSTNQKPGHLTSSSENWVWRVRQYYYQHTSMLCRITNAQECYQWLEADCV